MKAVKSHQRQLSSGSLCYQLAQSLVARLDDVARPVACCVIRFIVTGHKSALAVTELGSVHPGTIDGLISFSPPIMVGHYQLPAVF